MNIKIKVKGKDVYMTESDAKKRGLLKEKYSVKKQHGKENKHKDKFEKK